MDSPSSPAATRLADLPPNSAGVVVAFHGDHADTKRLRELGLVAGTRVRALRWAPLGDPLEIELRGYRLSLRRAEAALVEVRRDT